MAEGKPRQERVMFLTYEQIESILITPIYHFLVYAGIAEFEEYHNQSIYFSDDNESILSYGSGSVRSSARSPRKRVKLWHPSQDNVSPFLNESTERNMRRRLNSINAKDNSTQTPEKNGEPISLSAITPEQKETKAQNKSSSNDATSSSATKRSEDETESPSMPKGGRALDFEDLQPPHGQSSTVRNEDSIEPQPSTSAGIGSPKTSKSVMKPQRIPSLDSTSSNEGYYVDNTEAVYHNSAHSIDSSNEERMNDDHVFLRPKNYRKTFESVNQSRRTEKAKNYRFLETLNSEKQRLNTQKSKEPKKGKTISDWSPWRRAEQAADEDMTWTPSNVGGLPKRSSSSSDEDSHINRRRMTKKKHKQKGSNTKDGNSYSSDGSSKSHQPRFYQREEEIKIIDFIVKHWAFSRVKGNTLWKLMDSGNSTLKHMSKRPLVNGFLYVGNPSSKTILRTPCLITSPGLV